MSNQWQGEERRAHPRVSLKGHGSRSRVTANAIVDLSLSGALLEVSSTLDTSKRYTVRLELSGGEPLEIEGEVVRSYVHGFAKDENNLPAVAYRAAVRFVNMDPAAREELERIITPSKDSPDSGTPMPISG
jgi:hypothetical protein